MSEADILTPQTIVPFLADIFERRGAEEYLGENVTIAEHMLQGAYLAEQRGEDEQIIVAALLHDIGHFTSELGTFEMNDEIDRLHEDAGAEILERFFPPLITDCVRQHVAAKRYLCSVDPMYFGRLSQASVKSLELQGGPMERDEATEFAKNPNLDAIVKVRHLDDEGKIVGFKTPGFDHYAPMVQRAVDSHCSTEAA